MPSVLDRPKTVKLETVSKTTFNKALGLLNARTKIENKAILDLRELLTQLGLRYVRAVVNKTATIATEQFKDALDTLLLRSMLTASLVGYDQAQKEFSPIKLSLLRGELKFLKSISTASTATLSEFTKVTKGWSSGVSSRVTKEFNSSIERIVEVGVKRGATVPNITSRIAAFLPDVKRWKIHRAVRGQVNRAYAVGRESALNEVADSIVVEEYVAVGDDRTRPDHWARHGTRLPRSDTWWIENTPPLDDMCRCIKISHFDKRVQPTKRPNTRQIMVGRDKQDRPILKDFSVGLEGQIIDLKATFRDGDVGSIVNVWPDLKKEIVSIPGKIPRRPIPPYNVSNRFPSADINTLLERISQAEAYLSALNRWEKDLVTRRSNRIQRLLSLVTDTVDQKLSIKKTLSSVWQSKIAELSARIVEVKTSKISKPFKGKLPRKPKKPFNESIVLTGLTKVKIDSLAQKAESHIRNLTIWLENLRLEILNENHVTLANKLIGEGNTEIAKWFKILSLLVGESEPSIDLKPIVSKEVLVKQLIPVPLKAIESAESVLPLTEQKERIDKWENSLSKEETRAVNMFTNSISQAGDIRRALRGLPSKSAEMAEQFEKALEKFTPTTEVLFRGLTGLSSDVTAEMVKVGTVFTMNSPASFSSKRGVARRFAKRSRKDTVLVKVKSRSAVPVSTLSRFENEKEWVMQRGTQFKVVKSEKFAVPNGFSYSINLEEIRTATEFRKLKDQSQDETSRSLTHV